MFGRLFRRPPEPGGIPSALYGVIVAQARSPAFYRDFGVPDTVEGRLEMVMLHVGLAVRRLAAAGEAGRALGQEVFDLFCTDMDRSLREMGVGDLAVPKRMKRIGQSFYGRLAAYEAGLADRDPLALASAVRRNLPDGGALAAGRLAAYIKAADASLAAASPGEILAGGFPMPAPETVTEPIP